MKTDILYQAQRSLIMSAAPEALQPRVLGLRNKTKCPNFKAFTGRDGPVLQRSKLGSHVTCTKGQSTVGILGYL